MTDGDNLAPVGADKQTGAVVADLSDTGEPIARPARWVASFLWIILVVALAIVMVGSAGAIILDFIAPSQPPSASRDTVLLLFTGTMGALIALFSQRPGTH